MESVLAAPPARPGAAAVQRAVAIGTFDGVHRGHRAVLAGLAQTGLLPTVVTFDPHPRSFFGVDVPLLTTLERRIELLRQAGAAEVVIVEFSRETAGETAEEWIASTLLPLGARTVAVGSDFRFGRGRGGDTATLRRHGLDVIATDLVVGVSSTEVRRLVAEGHVGLAGELLGRPFAIPMTVRGAALTNTGGATLALERSFAAGVTPPLDTYWARVDGAPGLATLTDAGWGFVTPLAPHGWRRGAACELELTDRYQA